MEQFVLAPGSMLKNNKKIVNTLAVIKQELPKHQNDQNHTWQNDSVKKEINKKLFSKANSSVNIILSCPCIKLSNWQTLILDGVEAGVLLSEFAEQLRRLNSNVPDLYFILLYFTWSFWPIHNSGSEWKCQSQRERKLGFFQNMIVRSCKGCPREAVLLMGLHAS